MNRGQLLTHFDLISEAPGAISALRRLILNLAVRGKMVEQDSKDEPAATLLERVDKERVDTAKTDRRADAGSQSLLVSEHCWKIPDSWQWRGIADLALFIDYRGRTPTKRESGIRLITAKNVRCGFINVDPQEFIDEPTYAEWMTRGLPREGDVLFTTEAPMGNAAVLRLSEKVGLAQRVINFRLYGGFDPDFLVLQILAQPFQQILDSTATGLTAKGVKAAKLKRLPIAVPPLAEQHRIVAKVDELMALCDQLEAALAERERRRDRLTAASFNRLNHPADADVPTFREHAAFHLRHLPSFSTRPDQIPQLRQLILNLAVRGKLFPQDPNSEPASELAKRARLARREAWEAGYAKKLRNRGKSLPSNGWKSKYQLPKPATRQPGFELPVGWAWVAWREVGTCQNGRAFPSTDYSDSGIRLLRPGNLFADGSVVWNTGNTRFLPEHWAEEYPEFIVGEWEIVMNLTAQSLKDAFLGRACLTSVGERALLNQRIARLTSYATWPRYTLLLLKSAAFRNYVDGGLNQGALIQHMFTAQIDDFEFPLPPLAEQKRIVAKVDELLALCDQLESQLTTAQNESRQLLESVLQEALSVS